MRKIRRTVKATESGSGKKMLSSEHGECVGVAWEAEGCGLGGLFIWWNVRGGWGLVG